MWLVATAADASGDVERHAGFVTSGEGAAAVSAECSQQSRWAEFFSAATATARQWEDASSSPSLLFYLSFSSICCRVPPCLDPSIYCGEPHGARRHREITDAANTRHFLSSPFLYQTSLLLFGSSVNPSNSFSHLPRTKRECISFKRKTYEVLL